MKKKQVKTKPIFNCIRHENIKILMGGIFLTVFYTLCLVFAFISQRASGNYTDNLYLTVETMTEANQIYRNVDKIVYDNEPESILNLTTPKFNELYAVSSKMLGRVPSRAEQAKTDYESFLVVVNKVVQLNRTDSEAAKQLFDSQLTGSIDTLTESLQSIASSYDVMTGQSGGLVRAVIMISIIAGLVFLGTMTFTSLRLSKRLANDISIPVNAITEWAEELSQGVDCADRETIKHNGNVELVEINRMMKAFVVMSESIRENANVVQKVADGDMTAYVNIRSSEDSLGKSLYKMVQNNDLMFAQISTIADSVTEGTDSIATAAKMLAESCTEQATAIADLQQEITNTNQLTKENAENAAHASELSDYIKNEVVVSKEKMHELVAAMKAIYDASAKVSGVIANIESLANQTNLLAINATIEAKRAGEAGKSFAVVASSVKDLADKSALSATQTKELIDDTISKAKRGSQLSDETYMTFENIMNSLEQIIDVSGKIADSGVQQQDNMQHIETSIDEISKIVSSNAASSEETAAMTVEISKNSDVLKASMKQFTLRRREPGKPYIPPEKANDAEFVRVATENYNKFLNTAEGKRLMEEIRGDKLRK